VKKNSALAAIVAAVLILIVKNCHIQSVEEFYSRNPTDLTEDSRRVTLTVECSDIFDHWDDLDKALREGDFVPKNGTFIESTDFVLLDGDSAFDLLERALAYEKIALDYDGTAASAYVTGIGGIYEFSCGASSGWQYEVNGIAPNVGCSDYELTDGDNVVFTYICDYNEVWGGAK
jgi:hypothetical protein